jgi:hypothetical protein
MAKIKLKSKLNKSANSDWEIVDDIPMAQKGLSTRDSINVMGQKHIDLEHRIGYPGGNPNLTASMTGDRGINNVIDYVENQGYGSAMNQGQINSWLYNAGFDFDKKKQTINPKKYILGEYYRKYSPYKKEDWDANWGWKGRSTINDQDAEKLYKEKVSKLPEEEQRVLINLAKDWFYKNRSGVTPNRGVNPDGSNVRGEYGDWSSDYEKVWAPMIKNQFEYGNLKNTPTLDKKDKIDYNEYYERQTVPRQKKNGGSISQQGYRDDSPYRNRESIDIHSPNGLIDMSETGMPILANGRYLPPYSGMHQFEPGVVREERIMQNGGNFKNYNWKENREYKNNPANLNSRGGLDLGVSKNLPFGFRSSAGVGFDEGEVNYRAGLGYNNNGLRVNTDYNSSGRLNASVNYNSPIGLNAGFRYSDNKGEETYSGNLGYSGEKIPVGLNTGYTHTSKGHNANADLNFNTKNINGNFGYEYNQDGNNSFNAGVNVPFLGGMGNVGINSKYNIGDKQPSVNVGGTFKFQNGGQKKPTYTWSTQETSRPSITAPQNNVNVSKTTGNRKLTKEEIEQLALYTEIQNQLNKEREYNQRKQNIQQSIEAQGQPLSTENLKTQTQATGDKLSFAMNTPYGDPNQYPVASQYMNALDEINPFKMVGDMASGLGAAPQDVKEGNYLKAAMSVVNPLAVGALAGMGTQGTKQFVNELVNPFAGINFRKPKLPEKNITCADGSCSEGLSNIADLFSTPEEMEKDLESFFSQKKQEQSLRDMFNQIESRKNFSGNIENQPLDFIKSNERRVIDLDSDIDYNRYLESSNQLPPPPSEIRFLDNTRFYNNVEPNINTTRIRDLSPDILGSIDLRKYKDLNIKELTLKNPSLAEKLKNKLSKQYDILKGKVKQKDIALGQFLDKNVLTKTQKIQDVVDLANENLKKGMGVSKEKLNIELKPVDNDNVSVFVNGKNTGYISIPSMTKNRSLSQILSGESNKTMGFEKAQFLGRRKTFDFPFQKEGLSEYQGKGISGEINTAISEALKAKGERLYSGATGHSAAGAKRYDKLIKKEKVDVIDPINNIYMYKKFGGNTSDWEIIEDVSTYQKGGSVKDMYKKPINSKIKNTDESRSRYDSRFNEILLGEDYKNATPEQQEKILAHEGFHAKQFAEGKSRFITDRDIPYKRPSIVSTDEIYDNYHNRKQVESDIDVNNWTNQNPSFKFAPRQLVFNNIVDNQQYNNPYSLEGEATYYENLGEIPPTYQKGGKVVSEIWQEVTGTPWSEAKKIGLTKGGYEENLAIRKELLKNPEKFVSLINEYSKQTNTQPPVQQSTYQEPVQPSITVKLPNVNENNSFTARSFNQPYFERDDYQETPQKPKLSQIKKSAMTQPLPNLPLITNPIDSPYFQAPIESTRVAPQIIKKPVQQPKKQSEDILNFDKFASDLYKNASSKFGQIEKSIEDYSGKVKEIASTIKKEGLENAKEQLLNYTKKPESYSVTPKAYTTKKQPIVSSTLPIEEELDSYKETVEVDKDFTINTFSKKLQNKKVGVRNRMDESDIKGKPLFYTYAPFKTYNKHLGNSYGDIKINKDADNTPVIAYQGDKLIAGKLGDFKNTDTLISPTHKINNVSELVIDNNNKYNEGIKQKMIKVKTSKGDRDLPIGVKDSSSNKFESWSGGHLLVENPNTGELTVLHGKSNQLKEMFSKFLKQNNLKNANILETDHKAYSLIKTPKSGVMKGSYNRMLDNYNTAESGSGNFVYEY